MMYFIYDFIDAFVHFLHFHGKLPKSSDLSLGVREGV